VTKLKVKFLARGVAGLAGRVVGRLFNRAENGETTMRTVVLDLRDAIEIDVSPGQVLLEVRLPSGDQLSAEKTITARAARPSLTVGLAATPPKWLGLQHVLSPPVEPGAAAGARVRDICVHRAGAAPLRLAAGGHDRKTRDGGVTYAVHSKRRTTSLTVEGYTAPRPLVELRFADGAREIVAPPLPWLGDGGEPEAVQLISDESADGTRADVLVHDATFSPVLAYYAVGNREAARELATLIEDRARAAVDDAARNPCAAVAGFLVLRLLHRDKQGEWLPKLAECPLADGAILYAGHLLDTRAGRSDPAQVRRLLLEGRRRGLPAFAACGRQLRTGLERVASLAPDDPEVAAALDWARDLVGACRSDTIITWLSADDATLGRIVPEVPPPPE
jgi:hypothetical protein